MRTIAQSTQEYEAWLARFTELYTPDLEYKHQKMADATESFSFFRGTYYRWAEHWQLADARLRAAPVVPSVGDLHIENFGTWRDIEGRLIWGVNDFDEAWPMSYVNDLVLLPVTPPLP